MADQNPFDQLLLPAKESPAPALSPTPSSNPFDNLVSSASQPSAPPLAASAPVSSNPFDNLVSQPTQESPFNGQDSGDASEHRFFLPSHKDDPSKSTFRNLWDAANVPILDFTALGTREGAGPIERGLTHGVESIASGFTSPLSALLTLATFGTGGAIESGGASLLRSAGMSAEEIANASKASEIALRELKDLKPIEPAIQQALEAGGHDLGLFNRAKEALGPIDLSDQFGAKAEQLAKAGFSDSEINALGEMGEKVAEAKRNFTPIKDAIEGAGLDYNKFKQAQDLLYENGLNEHDLLGGNLLERGAFQVLRKVAPGMSYAGSARAAKTANTLLNAGFTLQQLQGAAEASPRFFDALENGDYEAAAEYGTQAAAGAGFGLLGIPHALHSAGELFKPLLATDKFRPNDQFLQVERAAKANDVQKTIADQEALRIDEAARTALGHKVNPVFGTGEETKGKQDLELASIFHQVVTGGDRDKAAQWHDALSEAAGRGDRIGGTNENPKPNSLGLKITRAGNDFADLVHGTSPENKEALLKSGQFDPSKGERQYDYSEWGPDAVYLGQRNGPWVDKERVENMRGVSYDAQVNAGLSPDAKVLHLENYEDVEKLADAVGIKPQTAEESPNHRPKSAVQVMMDALYIDSLSGGEAYSRKAGDPALEESREVANKIKALGVDAVNIPKEIEEKKGTSNVPTGEQVVVLNPSKAVVATSGVYDPKTAPSIDGWGKVQPYTENGKSFWGTSRWNQADDRAETRPLTEEEVKRFHLPKPDQAFRTPEPRPVNGQTPEIADQIARNKFKTTPKDYQDLILNSLKRVANGELSDKELEAAKTMREEDAKNYEIGNANDVLNTQIENHMTRLYKDQNPDGRVVVSNAKRGAFTTNPTAARHQVYDSHLGALLLSPKEIVMDPIRVVAQNRADVIKAAANRQLIDELRDNFTRGSDGRPAVVISGAGNVVQGSGGEDPRTMINPNRVRKIQIADQVIDHLRETGDLQRFLEDGTIKDVTPYVRRGNIASAIDRLEQLGISQNPKFDEEGNNILRQRIQGLKDIQSGVRPEADLQAYNDNLGKKYVWSPHDYIPIDHPAFRSWTYASADPSGNPVFVKGEMQAHPEFAQYLSTRLGLEKSALQEHALTRGLLKAGGAAKKLLLDFSPFHLAQEALRATMIGMNPIFRGAPDIMTGEKIDPSNPHSPTKLYKAVEQGMTLGTDYHAQQAMSEGVAAGGDNLLRKVPGVGKLADFMNWYRDALFKRIIPGYKARGAELMWDKYQAVHPDWSTDKIGKAVATHMNLTFGGIPWRQLGVSSTNVDLARLITLAPDWLASEMGSAARLFNKDEGGISRQQFARMALTMWGLARVLNYAGTGAWHPEAPFGVAHRDKNGKEVVYGLRTLPSDVLHMISSPVEFLQGRMSPTLKTGIELVTQRDRFGRKLEPQDLWADVSRQLLPIPAQQIGQALSGTGPDVGNVGQMWKAVGGSAQTYLTPAQHKAAELASNHSEQGPLEPVQMKRHRAVLELEDRLRSGQIGLPDLYRMVYQTDDLKESELKKIENNYKATRLLDAPTAQLYARASRLPAPQYFEVFDQMNPAEKVALLPLTRKVMQAYLRKSAKDLTPEQRLQDPTFRRIMAMLPHLNEMQQQAAAQ